MNPASLGAVQVTSKHLQQSPFLIDLGAGHVDMLTSRGGESGQFPTRKPQCTMLLMRAMIHDTLVNDVCQLNLLFSSTPPHGRDTHYITYRCGGGFCALLNDLNGSRRTEMTNLEVRLMAPVTHYGLF